MFYFIALQPFKPRNLLYNVRFCKGIQMFVFKFTHITKPYCFELPRWAENRQVSVGVTLGRGGGCGAGGGSTPGSGGPQQQPSLLVHLPEHDRLLRPSVRQQLCCPLPRLLVADVQDHQLRQYLAGLHC